MSGEALLFAAHCCEPGAPRLFLPFLIGEELLEVSIGFQ